MPFKEYVVHDREGNILFREFVHLLVWMAHHLDPNCEKPQKSIEKLINKIAPFLDSLNKVIKMSGSENMSENKSSISKTEKNLSSFYKNLNSDVFKTFVRNSQSKMLNQKDLTLKMR